MPGMPAEPLPIQDVMTFSELPKTQQQTVTDLNKIYGTNPTSFPIGSVSLNTFGNSHVNRGQYTNDDKGGKLGIDNPKKVGVGGRAEFWLRPRNAAYGPGARIELMPARRSFTPGQGQMIPGAGAGLEIRCKSNIARLPVPGARPIYQHMGIAEETISFVGAFCGFDIPEAKVDSIVGFEESYLSYGKKRLGDAWDEAMNVIEGIRAGWELELVMRWNSTPIPGAGDTEFADISLEYLPGIKYTGYVKHFVKEFATQQRVYYRMEFVVTNRQSVLAPEAEGVKAPDLKPTNITGGTGGRSLTVTAESLGSASTQPTGLPTVGNLPDPTDKFRGNPTGDFMNREPKKATGNFMNNLTGQATGDLMNRPNKDSGPEGDTTWSLIGDSKNPSVKVEYQFSTFKVRPEGAPEQDARSLIWLPNRQEARYFKDKNFSQPILSQQLTATEFKAKYPGAYADYLKKINAGK